MVSIVAHLHVLLLYLLVYSQGDGGKTGNRFDRDTRDYYEILECNKECTNEEFKKNYRKLALKYHPDKHGARASEEERQNLNSEFLKVQLAYETLSDEQKKLQYDLSLDGVHYDIREDQEIDRYHSRNFHLFMKISGTGASGKMFFSAEFNKPPIADLNINADIELADIAEERTISKKYWRKVQCKTCGGNGGLNGECRTCTLCEGKGYALHSFKHTSRSGKRKYDQWTETVCGSCNGKGCHPSGKCSKCNGLGTHMEELEAHITLPAFVHHGWNIFVEDGGHQEADGRTGGVKVFVWHRYPPGWYLNDDGQLQMELNVTLQKLVDGFETVVALPWGEKQNVTITRGTPIVKILKGFSIIREGMGIPSHDGHRGSVSVFVQWDFEDRKHFGKEKMLEVLDHSSLYKDDFVYKYMANSLNSNTQTERKRAYDFSEDYADSIQVIKKPPDKGQRDDEKNDEAKEERTGMKNEDDGTENERLKQTKTRKVGFFSRFQKKTSEENTDEEQKTASPNTHKKYDWSDRSNAKPEERIAPNQGGDL